MSDPFLWDENNQVSDEINGDIKPSLGRGEALSNVVDLAYTSSPFFSFLKYTELKRAESEDERPEIGTEELNEMYPDLNEPFQEPKKPSVAQIIANRQRLRMQIEKNISMGPDDYLQAGLSFGTGIVYSMMDPLSVGAAFGAEVALLKAANSGRVAALASRGGVAGKVGKGTQFLGETGFASTATRDVVAGLGEGVVTEGLVATSDFADNTPYETEDFFMNTIGGAIAVPAIAGSVRLGVKGMGKAFDFAAPSQVKDFLGKFKKKGTALQVAAKGSLDNGSNPDIGPIIADHVKEMDGLTPKFAGDDYKFEMLNLEKSSGGKVYAVHNQAKKTGPTSFDFEGEGMVFVTDSPMIANGVAGSKYESDFPSIQEFGIKEDLRIAKFDERLEGDERTIGEAIKQLKEGIRIGQNEPSDLQGFYDSLKAKGYDGVGGRLSDVNSLDIHDHNVLGLFNPDKLEMGQSLKPDKHAVGKSPEILDGAKQKQMSGPELIPDEDVRATTDAIADASEDVLSVENIRDFDPIIQEKLVEIETLESLGALTDIELKQLEALKANIAETEAMDQAMKAAEVCVGR